MDKFPWLPIRYELGRCKIKEIIDGKRRRGGGGYEHLDILSDFFFNVV